MVFQDPEIFPALHLTPYKEYWMLGEGTPPEHVYGEMYSLDAFFGAWESVQNQGHITSDGLKQVMVAIMLWSNSTHLMNFRSASLWPVYLLLGNQSKYIRTKPLSFCYHHLAYLPSVSPLCPIPVLWLKVVYSFPRTFKTYTFQYIRRPLHPQPSHT